MIAVPAEKKVLFYTEEKIAAYWLLLLFICLLVQINVGEADIIQVYTSTLFFAIFSFYNVILNLENRLLFNISKCYT